MFRSIANDFDSTYWTRGSIALLVCATSGASGGVAWLLFELLQRIGWFLLQLLLTWLFPPAFTLAVMPLEPITLELVERELDRGVADTVVQVDLNEDMGSFDAEFPPDPVLDVRDLPPDPRLVEERVARKEAMVAEIRSSSLLLAKIIGTTGESEGSAVASLWSDEGGLGDIDSALGTTTGISSGIRTSGGGGVAVGIGRIGTRGTGGGSAADIGDLAGVGGGIAVRGSGATTRVPKVSTGAMRASGGDLESNHIAKTMRRSLGRFRYCYESELKNNPALKGKVELDFAIAPDGHVSSASVVRSSGAPGLDSCLVSKLKRIRFPASDSGMASVRYPFVFTSD